VNEKDTLPMPLEGGPRPVGPGDTWYPPAWDLPGLAERIRWAFRGAVASAGQAVDKMMELGALLCEARLQCKEGEFEPWVDANCPFGERQAYRYIRYYKDHLMQTDEIHLRHGMSQVNLESVDAKMKMVDGIVSMKAMPDSKPRGERGADGWTDAQRPVAEYLLSHRGERDGRGPGIEQVMKAVDASRGVVHGVRTRLVDMGKLKPAPSREGSGRSRSRNRVKGRRKAAAKAPDVRGRSSFADRLPSRPDRDEESLRYLDTLPARATVDNTRFDDDATIYHAIEPLMKRIRELVGRLVRLRTTESMGPFYRLVHEMLRVAPPERWQPCDGCAARGRKDGTCRKCKGCGYLI